MNVNSISPEAQAILFEHPWPGNVRELEHAIEGAMNMMTPPPVAPDDDDDGPYGDDDDDDDDD